jgi:circadian clock protein KaiA
LGQIFQATILSYPLNSKLLVYVLTKTPTLETAIAQALPSHSYDVTVLADETNFIDQVGHESQTIDCLIVDDATQTVEVFSQLANLSILLPAVIIHHQPTSTPQSSFSQEGNGVEEDGEDESTDISPASNRDSRYAPGSGSDGRYGSKRPYHSAVVSVTVQALDDLPALIDRSIVSFLKLSLADSLPPETMRLDQQFQQQGKKVLKRKQQNLAQKLKERLGYLGVYYKREPTNFLRHMQPEDKKAFLAQLKQDYKQIVLGYFSGDTLLNQKIDAFVDTVFLADVPIAQVVEIHMDLMDEFAKQLQIEGRSEEILLDYRLTLIELLANLCEMYRRSIPREP